MLKLAQIDLPFAIIVLKGVLNYSLLVLMSLSFCFTFFFLSHLCDYA